MRKPVYKYPDFVIDVELDKTDSKRFWLRLIIDESKTESIIVILKTQAEPTKKFLIRPYIMSLASSITIEINTMLLRHRKRYYPQSYSTLRNIFKQATAS
jgi:hypothetical protein